MCGDSIGLMKTNAMTKYCDKCKKNKALTASRIRHKLKMKTDNSYRLKNNSKLSARNHIRRSIYKTGEVIGLYDLAERDDWQCKLCLMTIDKYAKHYKGKLNLQGPSLDHIIPVSKGGTHTWNNVQLAHYICNSLRGNKDLVTQ